MATETLTKPAAKNRRCFSDTNEPRLTIRAESVATFITCQQGGWLASFPPPLHYHDCFNVSITTTVKITHVCICHAWSSPCNRCSAQTAMQTVLPLCQDRHRPTSAAAPDPPPSWKLLLHLLPTWQCVAGLADMCDANLQDTMLTHISRPYIGLQKHTLYIR